MCGSQHVGGSLLGLAQQVLDPVAEALVRRRGAQACEPPAPPGGRRGRGERLLQFGMGGLGRVVAGCPVCLELSQFERPCASTRACSRAVIRPNRAAATASACLTRRATGRSDLRFTASTSSGPVGPDLLALARMCRGGAVDAPDGQRLDACARALPLATGRAQPGSAFAIVPVADVELDCVGSTPVRRPIPGGASCRVNSRTTRHPVASRRRTTVWAPRRPAWREGGARLPRRRTESSHPLARERPGELAIDRESSAGPVLQGRPGRHDDHAPCRLDRRWATPWLACCPGWWMSGREGLTA